MVRTPIDSWANVSRNFLYTESTHGFTRRIYPRGVPLESHWERVNTPVTRADRPLLLAGGILATLLTLVLLGTALIGSDPAPAKGCTREVVAMSMGGATVEHCRPPAR